MGTVKETAQGAAQSGTDSRKILQGNFTKPIDKPGKVCYNGYSKRDRARCSAKRHRLTENFTKTLFDNLISAHLAWQFSEIQRRNKIMTISKFYGHKNANAYHIDYEFTGREALQSYNTIVIDSIYDYANKRLRHIIHGLYSATTRKHIGWYAKLHNLAYANFKWAYEHDCDIIQDYKTGKIFFENRETGEILKIIEKN